jgi:hypothetical protein
MLGVTMTIPFSYFGIADRAFPVSLSLGFQLFHQLPDDLHDTREVGRAIAKAGALGPS